MKKIIQFLIIVVLLAIIALIVIFVFNPGGSRNKIIGSIINSYLDSHLGNYSKLPSDAPAFEDRTYDHPLLNDAQEKTLYEMGVDTSKLPTSISQSMQKCLVEKVGEVRAKEIVNGATPSASEIYKAKDCLNQ